MWISLTVVVLMTLPMPASGGATAATSRHTKKQAESNLLHASKAIARWGVGLIDPRTKLLRDNTIAICQGQGRPLGDRYPRFACTCTAARSSFRCVTGRGATEDLRSAS